jgi:hypothetical protein
VKKLFFTRKCLNHDYKIERLAGLLLFCHAEATKHLTHGGAGSLPRHGGVIANRASDMRMRMKQSHDNTALVD